MTRFNDDIFPLDRRRLSKRQLRQLAQRRAYQRWEDELARKYRSRLDERAEPAYQDYTTLEHLATQKDLLRLNEIVDEEMRVVGQRP